MLEGICYYYMVFISEIYGLSSSIYSDIWFVSLYSWFAKGVVI